MCGGVQPAGAASASTVERIKRHSVLLRKASPAPHPRLMFYKKHKLLCTVGPTKSNTAHMIPTTTQ
jgi:hypothetical protein